MRGSRGTIALLAASQGLLGTNNVVYLSVTGLAGYVLATIKAWATLPRPNRRCPRATAIRLGADRRLRRRRWQCA